jgi:hypothetical protein
VAGDPRRRDRHPRRTQDRRRRGGHVEVAPPRCSAASRPSSRSRTKSTSSGAPCSTPVCRTHPAGTRWQSPARRWAPEP